MLPALFLSHGATTPPLDDVPAHAFLGELGRVIGRPCAILVASAHWKTETLMLGVAARPETVHAVHGVPPELDRPRHPAPGAPELAEWASDLLCAAGIRSRLNQGHRLDHSVWAPLLLMYPEADIPVVLLSVQPHLGPAHHVQVGRALAPLRDEGVLVLGSGAFTHELSHVQKQMVGAETRKSAATFADWFEQALTEGRTCDLVTYRAHAPGVTGQRAADEHLLPLFVALGAGGPGAPARRLQIPAVPGVPRMDAWAFG